MLRLLTVVAASSIDPLAAYHLSAISRVNRYVVGSVVHADTNDPVRKFCRFFRDTFYHLLGQAPPSELTLATLNIGGDGPQPEYIAKDWDSVFGQVEKLLGATILALYHCPDGFMNGTLINHDKKAACHTKVLGTKFADRYYLRYQAVLDKPTHPPKGLVSEMLKKYINEDEVKALYTAAGMEDSVTFGDFAVYMFEPQKMPLVGKSPPKNGKAKAIGLSDIDKDSPCKQRRSFPFFGAGFLTMDKELRAKTFTVKSYTDSIENCPYVTGKFLPLLIFDLLVFDHFQDWFDKEDKIPAAIPEPDVDKKKQELVQAFLHEVEVLTLQEAAAAFNKPTEEFVAVTAELVLPASKFGAVATTGKKAKIDTAVLATHKLGTQDKNGEDLYGRWTKFVGEKIAAAGPEAAWMKPAAGPAMSKKDLDGASAVTVATTRVHGHRVLLMSMHPASNGRPCVLFAYLAMEFYNHLNEELEPNAGSGDGLEHHKFELLLVGGDWNVMTDADKEEKLAEEAAAFTEKGKDPETEPSDKNGFLWTEFKKAVVDYGFDIIHATNENGDATPTVNKVRTFLQTQIGKAAKVDETTKDVFLAYPAKLVKTEEVLVRNEVKNEQAKGVHAKFGLLKDATFPTHNWVLDHFATYARIEIYWPRKESNKAK